MSKPLDLHAGQNRAVTYAGLCAVAIFEGTPTASVAGYWPGALAIDVTNGKHYKNTGTAASTTWTEQTT